MSELDRRYKRALEEADKWKKPLSSLFDSGIRPIVDAHLLEESKKRRDYGEYFSASSAGYCMRKNIFERLGVPHTTDKTDAARQQRVFYSGHVFHEAFQRITKNAGISIAQELELQDEDLMVRGHIDDLVLVKSSGFGAEPEDAGAGGGEPEPDHLILYDYKTRNSRSFNFAKQPSPLHRLQLGTYMYMLRNGSYKMFANADSKNMYVDLLDGTLKPAPISTMTEARVLNIEKDTLRMAEVQYLWDEELERDILEYWTTLNKYWKERKMPKCTCETFMATMRYNPYYYQDEPCSMAWYEKWKKENAKES